MHGTSERPNTPLRIDAPEQAVLARRGSSAIRLRTKTNVAGASSDPGGGAISMDVRGQIKSHGTRHS